MVRAPRPSARADAASDVVNDDGLTQQLAHTLGKGRCRLWIKLGKTQSEQMFSASPPKSGSNSGHSRSRHLCRFCCKSRFAQGVKNSAGRRRGFRVKMRGTSSPYVKFRGDLGKATAATRIGGCFSPPVLSARNGLLAMSALCSLSMATRTSNRHSARPHDSCSAGRNHDALD
jgi:hypothetical protein